MIYSIIIRKSARKVLQKLDNRLKVRIVEKISLLSANPKDTRLNIKPLTGLDQFYRLRVGDWRIIFHRDEMIKVIAIERISSRGDAYKK